MTGTTRRLSLLASPCSSPSSPPAAATITMPLSQVKPGMIGRGKSVFQGQVIEEFEAEILGVLANASPKRSIILARLKGHGLESTGIIAGMSGSPVYIDGKLIGAVASGFSFSKEAIAGITPIDEMLAVGKAPEEARPGATAPLVHPGRPQPGGAFRGLREDARDGVRRRPAGPDLRAPRVPLVISGLSARGLREGPLVLRPARVPGRPGRDRAGRPVQPTSPRNRPSGKGTPWASSCSAAISSSPPSER